MLKTLDSDIYNIFKGLLEKSSKTYADTTIYYGTLNPAIEYNRQLSRMIECCDDAITALIENDRERAEESLTKIFFNDGKLYDYIIQSGIYDKLASQLGYPTLPISYIGKNQKIIVNDTRKVKTPTFPLEEVEEFYDSINPIGNSGDIKQEESKDEQKEESSSLSKCEIF